MAGLLPNRSSSDPTLSSAPISNGRLILRLLGVAWQYRLQALRIVIIQLIMLAMALSGLGLTGLGIDVLRQQVDPDAKTVEYPFGLVPPEHWPPMLIVGVLAGAVLFIAALRFFFDRWGMIWKAKLVQDIIVDLRAMVYDKLQRLSFRFFDANESGSIINRVTGDVQAVRLFVDGVMVEVLMLVLSLAFFLFYMLNIHVKLTLACLATTPLLWFTTALFSRIVRPAYQINRELADHMVRVLSENVQGVHVVKGFWRQREEIAKFAHANGAMTRQRRWIFWRVSTFSPLIGFLPQLNLVVLLVYGGWIYMHDPTFQLGTGMFVFAGVLQQFSTQVGNIAQIANSVQQSLTGAQRVFEVLDAPLEVTSPPNPVPLARSRGEVRFEGVWFSYKDDGDPALAGVNLHIKAGQSVAILGATGAGKSTLLSLIPRFYDPDRGRVLIDGVDVKSYDLDDLRRNIGMVFQESFLFSNTVAANIAFGHPEATREQIERAARIAGAHEFVVKLPKGYDTVLGERASNLSGGQRQRLAIARAVLLQPPILLLDDPTAAIDPQTEHEILQAMNNAMKGRTTFVVAHRLSTLRRADLVLVLEHGRIVQQGTHAELMNTRGHYRRAAKLQIADAESKRLLGIEWDPDSNGDSGIGDSGIGLSVGGER